MSIQEIPVTELGVRIGQAEVVSEAILRAVFSAESAYGFIAAKDLHFIEK